MHPLTDTLAFIRRQPLWRLAAAAIIIAAASLLWLNRGPKSAGNTPTFTARRGPLDISVLEGGSLQALESQEIKCEVRVGYQGTKILRIVEEGYLVTDDDVKTNKVLVELDSSDIQKQILQQEIQYQSAVASLTDAQQNYEIQLGQNQSDINAAEQKARFARMDFDKLLGGSVTDQIIAEAGLDALLAAVTTNNVEITLNAETASESKPAPRPGPQAPGPTPPRDVTALVNAAMPVVTQPPGVTPPASTNRELPARPATETTDAPGSFTEMPRIRPVDFAKYANIDLVGDGEAKQKLRKFEDDLQMAQRELGQATNTLEGTLRLFDKGFASKDKVTGDEITHENARLKVQTANTAQALFLRYDFPKSAEEALSKYADAVRELDKARRVAISRLAQARARLNSARGQFDVQLRQRKDLQEQLDKCILPAQRSGLVVYGSGRGDEYMMGGGEGVIREGATVRERQSIITIPDMTHMGVNVKVHESYINKVKKGQQVRITVDAFPDEPLTGEVTKVALLPDSQNRWMNPDLKVYLTTIAIHSTNDWIKPGMSAKVEILVKSLPDVIYVPMQAVAPENGSQVCYVMNGATPERREVAIGDFTDEFIEIKTGVKEGERVLLRPPRSAAPQKDAPDQEAPKDDKPTPSSPPAAATAPAPAAKT